MRILNNAACGGKWTPCIKNGGPKKKINIKQNACNNNVRTFLFPENENFIWKNFYLMDKLKHLLERGKNKRTNSETRGPMNAMKSNRMQYGNMNMLCFHFYFICVHF